MARLGLGYLGEPSAREMARLSLAAEAKGFESIWTAETRFTRDGITTATAIALATSQVRVATGVLNVYTRGAVLTAITMATLDELSGGRAVFGIGPGSPLVLQAQGYAFEQPLRRLREYVAAVRAVWRGESFQGDLIQVDGVQLDFEPVRESIPVSFGVTGPRALALAGEIADGVILNSPTPIEYTRRAAENVRTAAIKAGRDQRAVEIAGDLMLALDEPDLPGREAVRWMVATYLTRFPNLARESGVPEETLAGWRELALVEGVDAVAARLPDEVVDSLSVTGTPEQCRARIQQYRDAGMDLPVLSPLPHQIERVIEELAPE